MMESHIRRLAALLLTSALLLGLVGCGKAAPDEAGLPTVRLEHVYQAETLASGLDADFGLCGVRDFDGQVYLSRYISRDWEDEEGFHYEESISLSRLTEELQTEQLHEFKSENRHTETGYWGSYVNAMCPDPEGGVWIFREEYGEDWSDEENPIITEGRDLIHFAADGSELLRIPVEQLRLESSEYEPYVQSLFVCADGRLLAQTVDAAALFAPDGTRLMLAELNRDQNGYIYSLIATGGGDVVALTNFYSQTTMQSRNVLQKLNSGTGSFEELGDMPVYGAYEMIGGPGHTLYLKGSSGLYAYDLETKSCEEILNWINSDINVNRIVQLSACADGSFLLVEGLGEGGQYGVNGYMMYDGEQRLLRLRPVAAGDVAEKVVISLGATYLDNGMQDAVIGFNRKNSEYRIVFKDYSQFQSDENYKAGIEQLRLDIASGSAPDLFLLAGLPVESLARQGMLMNLGQRMEQDESLQRSDYLENILDAAKIGGKLYSLNPAAYVVTAVGKAANVGTEPGLTPEKLQALQARFPEAALFSDTTRSDALSLFLLTTLNQYVDPESGDCHFDSPDFEALLELVKTFPEKIDWESRSMDGEYWDKQESQYREDRTLLEATYLHGFNNCRELEYNFGGDYTYVGLPDPKGIGAAVYPIFELGVSSKTKLADVCWSFIRYLLSEEYQDGLSNAFPIRRSSLERLAREATEKPNDGGRFSWYEPEDVRSQPATAEQTQKIMDLLGRVSAMQRGQEELLLIIEEECGAFFAGQRDAKTTAANIQSRVQITVSEMQ